MRFHSKVITTDNADILHLQKDELDIEKAYIKKEERIHPSPSSAYSQPEFGEFIDFSQPELIKEKNTNKKPLVNRSLKKELTLLSSKQKDNKLPNSLSRYFKKEPVFSPDDDELL